MKAKVVENEAFSISIIGEEEPLKVFGQNDRKTLLTFLFEYIHGPWRCLVGRNRSLRGQLGSFGNEVR